jgi:hypothetical protein
MKEGGIKTKVKFSPDKKTKSPGFKDPQAIEPSRHPDERDYEAESGLDTLTRAHDLMSSDDMMKRIAKHAGQKHGVMKAVLGLVKGKSKPKITSLDALRARRDEVNKGDGDFDGE